jgi:multidrug efflux pump subunit AcrA (membrane-fusion protein)
VYQGEKDALASVTAALHTKVREGEALRADNRILSTRNSELELFVAGATKSIFLMEERLSARDLDQRKHEAQLKSLRAQHGSEVDRGRELEEEQLKNMQAELQQQLHNAQVDLEDTRRQGDALREDNRILSIHNADVERQIEDERSAKCKAGERHIGMCKRVVQRTLRNQLLMAWNMFVDTVRVAQHNRKTVSKVLNRLRHRQLVQVFDWYAAAVDTLVVQRQLKNAREELEQRLHDTKAELEDIIRHGEALRADNQLLNQHNLSLSTQNTELERNLSTHYADLKQQVEDERSAKMKAV